MPDYVLQRAKCKQAWYIGQACKHVLDGVEIFPRELRVSA